MSRACSPHPLLATLAAMKTSHAPRRTHLLIVTSSPEHELHELHGVAADSQRTEDGFQVFYRGALEVARVPAGQALVVRDLHEVRARVTAGAAAQRPTVREMSA